ncbi:hypothetical protein N802_17900 [Knoellia sinensis KCTC 19936]|uniref:Uncharacterized protein n=1 Tax=Knoellia sinensis KCTC 19936 TaxID=1385520 RepID=A0A0A0J9I7_9MICO|nr:hypothetical protein [Knoellia sinensis]KGN32702.1 hypothetical protein N802_17900 [Knoellia sinensis KCTC 19936]
MSDAMIKMRRVGTRRRGLLLRNRPAYEVVIGRDGRVLFQGVTTAPTTVLVSKGGIHTTDSWDWQSQADLLHAQGSNAWITNPYENR